MYFVGKTRGNPDDDLIKYIYIKKIKNPWPPEAELSHTHTNFRAQHSGTSKILQGICTVPRIYVSKFAQCGTYCM